MVAAAFGGWNMGGVCVPFPLNTVTVRGEGGGNVVAACLPCMATVRGESGGLVLANRTSAPVAWLQPRKDPGTARSQGTE